MLSKYIMLALALVPPSALTFDPVCAAQEPPAPLERRALPRLEGSPEPIPGSLPPGENFSPIQKQQTLFLSAFSKGTYLLRAGLPALAAQALAELPENRADWPYRSRLLETKTALASGQKDKIPALCEAVIRDFPQEPDAYLILSDYYARAGEAAKATQTLEEGRKALPRQHFLLQSLHQQYSQQYRDAKTPEARAAALDKLENISQSIVEARPGVPSAPYFKILAFIKIEKNKPKEAIGYLENLLLLQPGDTDNFLQLARLQMQHESREKALATQRRAAVMMPEDPAVQREINSILLVKDGKSTELLQFYKSLAEEYPGRADLQTRYAIVLTGMGKPAEAIRVVRALLDLDAYNEAAWLLLARLEANQGNGAAVSAALENYLKYGETSTSSLLQTISILLATGNLEQSRKYIQKLRALDPNNPELVELETQSLVQSGNFEDALAALKKAIQKTPERAYYYLQLAALMEKQGRLEEAIPTLEQGLKKLSKEDAGDLREVLVQALMETGNYTRAAELAKQTVQDSPKNWKMKTTLLRIYKKSGQLDKVDPGMEQLRKDYPNDADVLYELALLQWDLKRMKEAEAGLKRVLQLVPDFAEACNSLGYFYAEENTNLDEAQTLVQKALTLKPGAGHIMDSLGWVYYRKGDYEKALPLLEGAAKKIGNDPVVLDHLADTYLKLKRVQDARGNLEKALAKVKEEDLKSRIQQKLRSLSK